MPVAISFQRYGGAPASQYVIRSSWAASTWPTIARTCPISPALSGGAGRRRALPAPRNQVRQLPAPGSIIWPLAGGGAPGGGGRVFAPHAGRRPNPEFWRV